MVVLPLPGVGAFPAGDALASRPVGMGQRAGARGVLLGAVVSMHARASVKGRSILRPFWGLRHPLSGQSSRIPRPPRPPKWAAQTSQMPVVHMCFFRREPVVGFWMSCFLEAWAPRPKTTNFHDCFVGLAAFGGQAQNHFCSLNFVVLWPWCPRHPKNNLAPKLPILCSSAAEWLPREALGARHKMRKTKVSRVREARIRPSGAGF